MAPLVLLTGACNTVTTGHDGVLTFTPDECGESGCSLDDDLAVGGSLLVSIDEADVESGIDLDDLTLITNDPSVVQIERVSRSSFESEWRVHGVGSGWAELIVIDRYGYEIDHTDIDVRHADRLAVQHTVGDAVGPTARMGFDGVWTVNAEERVALEIAPYRNGSRLTGRMAYQVDIDSVLFEGRMAGSDLEEGELEFKVPMGEYPVSFRAADGTTLRLLIIAQ